VSGIKQGAVPGVKPDQGIVSRGLSGFSLRRNVIWRIAFGHPVFYQSAHETDQNQNSQSDCANRHLDHQSPRHPPAQICSSELSILWILSAGVTAKKNLTKDCHPIFLPRDGRTEKFARKQSIHQAPKSETQQIDGVIPGL
jgi:hypothetical protein